MWWKNKKSRNKISKQYFSEEVLNVLTHITTLIIFAFLSGVLLSNTNHFWSNLIYCFATVNLFAASVVYHYFEKIKIKKMLQILDHASINLLIAASYTPFMLVSDGSIMLTIIWSIAILNILDMVYSQKVSNLNVVKYLVMGWMIMLQIDQVYASVPLSSFLFLLGGGVAYTVGTYFFINDANKKFYHTIWHVLVSIGSFCHFTAIYLFSVS